MAKATVLYTARVSKFWLCLNEYLPHAVQNEQRIDKGWSILTIWAVLKMYPKIRDLKNGNFGPILAFVSN